MITEHLDFTGKVAIVTGGATGIGYATALQLAKLGARVVICSRTVDELEAAATRIAIESGSKCLAVPTDVKDEAACIALVERTVAEFGRIDILINNAGGTRMGPLESIPTRGWDSIFDLNVKSAYILHARGRQAHDRAEIGRDRQRLVRGGDQRGEGRGALFRRQVRPADVHQGHRRRMGQIRHSRQLRRRRCDRLAARVKPPGTRRTSPWKTSARPCRWAAPARPTRWPT